MSAIIIKTETAHSHSTEMTEWITKCTEGLDRLIDEIHVSSERVLSNGIPLLLITSMETYWATIKDKNLSRYELFAAIRHIYEQVDLLQKEYCSKFKAGKMHYYIYYIAYRFSLEVMDEMNRAECALTKTHPSGYRKWMDIPSDEEQDQEFIDGPEHNTPPPEWETRPPEWTTQHIPEWEQTDDDDTDGYEEAKEEYPISVNDYEWEDSSVPSLFRYDPKIPINAYLHSEENAKLFMTTMFTDNGFIYSNIVPDRLYKQLPGELREIVDEYNKLTIIVVDVENLCLQLGNYIAREEELPFAYIYVAKFILKQINKVVVCPH
jgi:hypothetical protein